MKLTLTSEGVRIRLTYAELEALTAEAIYMTCAGWEWTVQSTSGPISVLTGWPSFPLLKLGTRDFHALQAEPENGIILNTVTPKIIMEVDKRDRLSRI
jgi:hypothetical protein